MVSATKSDSAYPATRNTDTGFHANNNAAAIAPRRVVRRVATSTMPQTANPIATHDTAMTAFGYPSNSASGRANNGCKGKNGVSNTAP